MPRVPGLDTLPPEARRWLQTQWRRHTGWGDNQRLAEELSQRLTQEGRAETYSPSTLWRWAQVDRRQAEAITHAAAAGRRGAVRIAFDLRNEKERNRA